MVQVSKHDRIRPEKPLLVQYLGSNTAMHFGIAWPSGGTRRAESGPGIPTSHSFEV